MIDRYIKILHTKVVMIKIRCAHCNRIVFRYIKIGKGRLWHCWKTRIVEDYSIHDEKEVKCECGNIIGLDEGKWIKMKQNSFIYTGTRLK